MDCDIIIQKIREIYNDNTGFIPLHAPVFSGNEKKYVLDTIESTFVSSVGEYVNEFERKIAAYVSASYGVAIVNGTNALQLALILAGVKPGDEVITQPLTFVATANAISHAGAVPVFVDVDLDTLGMSPVSLEKYIEENTTLTADGVRVSKKTGKRVAACVPMHTFGLPVRIKEIQKICEEKNIVLVEDAAESLGSFYGDQHTGSFGKLGVFSFNGNKTITCGGGGAIVTNDPEIGKRAKHLSTTAKIQHPWLFVHDEVGYNYRMPNINAALGCAQLEQLPAFLASKRDIHRQYADFFAKVDGVRLMEPIEGTTSNNWLNTILFDDPEQKTQFLKESNSKKVMTRPIWELMTRLPMYSTCEKSDLANSEYLEARIVNIPSTPIISEK